MADGPYFRHPFLNRCSFESNGYFTVWVNYLGKNLLYSQDIYGFLFDIIYQVYVKFVLYYFKVFIFYMGLSTSISSSNIETKMNFPSGTCENRWEALDVESCIRPYDLEPNFSSTSALTSIKNNFISLTCIDLHLIDFFMRCLINIESTYTWCTWHQLAFEQTSRGRK